MSRRVLPGWRLALIVLGATAMLAVATASVAYRLTAPSDGTRAGYVTSSLSSEGLVVGRLPGADTPLLDGDRVMAVGGVDLEAALAGGARRHVDGVGLGDAVDYTIVRGGRTLDVEVPLAPYPLGAVLGDAFSTLLFCAAMLGVAAFVFLRRPRDSATGPLLIAASGLAFSTVPWLLGFQALDLARVTGFWLWAAAAFVAYSAFWSASVHFALVFPARLPLVDRVPALIPGLYVGPVALLLAGYAVEAGTTGSTLDGLASLTALQLGLVLASCVGIGAAMVAQYRTTDRPASRQQVRWIVWASSVSLALTVGLWYLPELVLGGPVVPWSLVGIVGIPVPISIAIAVLRHRLFDIDVVINRSLVYGTLTVVVVAVYGVSVALLGSVLRGSGGFAASLLATGVAALVALPVHDRLQVAVNRLMYGERDDPYGAITRLGARLASSLTTDEVLPTVVTTVASALRLPYVAIELGEPDAMSVAASTGDPDGRELVRLPLVHQGEDVGRLVVAPRSAREGFGAADRRLLEGLVHEAGKAARSVRLAAEVDRSRRALVAAREEERRRLRRDLHDGLGPTLAGARLKVQAARTMLEARPDDAGTLLGELDEELAGVLDDVRRIARGLRPPALDELGLMPAIREQAARFSVDSGLDLRVEGPDALPPLPAAVEAAAYRIAVEAMTNVRRHSAASHCAVRVRLGDALEVEVEDDGAGIPPGSRDGIGLVSMRERAVEVGGRCEVGSRPGGGGTRVRATLPLAPTGAA